MKEPDISEQSKPKPLKRVFTNGGGPYKRALLAIAYFEKQKEKIASKARSCNIPEI